LISNFRHILNVVSFLPGNFLPVKMEQSVPKRWHIKFRRSQTFSHKNTPTLSTPVILHTYPPMKMEQTVYRNVAT